MVSGKANSSSRGSDCRSEIAGSKEPAKGDSRRAGRPKRKAAPLDQTSLHDLALSYVARFATSGARLETYLRRKLRERGIAEDGEGASAEIDVPALVGRMIELGYLDDDAYARMRSRDLRARGYGARRVEQALWAAGIDDDLRDRHRPSEAASRRAAMLMAQKRRIGPYGHNWADEAADPAQQHKAREKAIAAMLRAGHELAHARFILDAADIVQLEEWLAEAEADAEQEE